MDPGFVNRFTSMPLPLACNEKMTETKKIRIKQYICHYIISMRKQRISILGSMPTISYLNMMSSNGTKWCSMDLKIWWELLWMSTMHKQHCYFTSVYNDNIMWHGPAIEIRCFRIEHFELRWLGMEMGQKTVRYVLCSISRIKTTVDRGSIFIQEIDNINCVHLLYITPIRQHLRYAVFA